MSEVIDGWVVWTPGDRNPCGPKKLLFLLYISKMSFYLVSPSEISFLTPSVYMKSGFLSQSALLYTYFYWPSSAILLPIHPVWRHPIRINFRTATAIFPFVLCLTRNLCVSFKVPFKVTSQSFTFSEMACNHCFFIPEPEICNLRSVAPGGNLVNLHSPSWSWIYELTSWL